MRNRTLFLVTFGVVAAAGVAAADNPRHAVPASTNGDLVVALCDGQTTLEVKGVKQGETMARDKAQTVADELMDQWKKKNVGAGRRWDSESLLAQNTPPPAGDKTGTSSRGAGTPAPATAPAPGTQAGPSMQTGTYESQTTRDELIWRASTQAFVDQGDKVFHDAKALGGTIGVSCDMCHPNAANTHPETYPKFQVQLGRVALLRDMINWCIENPVRAKPLADDDPKLKALEAYVLAQRKGVALDYGKR